ncbi:MAG: hypothetical protein KF744_13900 [Taibaiella sp.]|nr:hypothetical protein [Taibaiella sp.]
MKKVAFMLLAASVLIFSGCTKTGPPGPQGVQGPQGNANVIGSDPFTVSLWSQDGNSYRADFNSSDITADIVDRGIVSVFKSYGTSSNPEWSPLPDINGNVSTVFNFRDGAFTIWVANTDGTVTSFPGSLTFRMVVVAPALKQANPNTDWKNYNEVMRVLHNEATVQNASAQ